ncbi:NAD-dependent protein deacylase Sirt4-like [Prorops nasuta]|uniref:NAD-dependent protein deacylase Sirt4-like n=1 Tax=Prorops nasuta TaxID=863751 RepID=UPI0034CD9A28
MNNIFKTDILKLNLKCATQKRISNLAFVPKCKPINQEDVLRLKEFVNSNNKMLVLTGAGISTESGIPDYRSTGVGLYAKSTRKPILYQEFCSNESIRQRYWARNFIGWQRFSSTLPNNTHKAIKQLEDIGKINFIVTQNVDNLHSKAGSFNVIELHGTAFRVLCLTCNNKFSRHDFQTILDKLNPHIKADALMIRPDGDVDISEEHIKNFQVPPCENCGGNLKPDIVFFGDNVPRSIVEEVEKNVNDADALLILGTSLTTYSGYRIVLQASNNKIPIAIVNIGKTRADKNANLKVEAICGDIISKIIPN